MKTFFQETKKIFRPRMLIFTLMITGLLCVPLLLHFWDKDRFGQYDKALIEVTRQISNKYGPYFSDEEMAELKQHTKELMDRIETIIADYPYANQNEVYSYNDFARLFGTGDDEKSGIYANIREHITAVEHTDIVNLYYIESAIERSWDNTLDILKEYPKAEDNPFLNDELTDRLYRDCIYSTEEKYRGIFMSEITEGTSKYFCNLAIIGVVAIIVMISPLTVRDKMAGMDQQQFPSKTGRTLYIRQFLAVMVTAFVMTTLYIMIFGSAFLMHHTLDFRNNSLLSFLNPVSLDITYGSWFLLLILSVYLFLLGTAGITYYVSSLSRNYVGMIIKNLPMAIAIVYMISISIKGFLTNGWYVEHFQTVSSLWYSIAAAAILFIIGIVLGCITCIKGKKQEV